MSIQNVNVARYARNVEWDFFCDFQTPCFCEKKRKVEKNWNKYFFQNFNKFVGSSNDYPVNMQMNIIIFITFSHANFFFFYRFLMISWQWKKGRNPPWCWTWINVMLTVPWAILLLLPVYLFNNLLHSSSSFYWHWFYFE